MFFSVVNKLIRKRKYYKKNDFSNFIKIVNGFWVSYVCLINNPPLFDFHLI